MEDICDVDMLLDKGDAWGRVVFSVTEQGVEWKYLLNGILTTVSLPSSKILNSELRCQHTLTGVTIHYVRVTVNDKNHAALRRAALTFWGSRAYDANVSIRKLLKYRESHRPHRILVFVNPISGWMNSASVYEETVDPIFKLCQCHATTIHTKHQDHIRQYLLGEDLSSFDVIVPVGGDGSFKEVVHGLLEQATREAGIDMDTENAPITKATIPVALIPSGTGMVITHALNKTKDVETAVISVILGKTTPGDIIGIRNGGKFMGYGNIFEEIGTLSNVMPVLDRLRFIIKKQRYKFFFLMMWWLWKPFKVKIEYIPVIDKEKEFRLQGVHDETHDPRPIKDFLTRFQDGPTPGWKTYEGVVSTIYFFNSHMKNFVRDMPLDFSPFTKPVMSTKKAHIIWDVNPSVLKTIKRLAISLKGIEYTPRSIIHQEEITECRISSAETWATSNPTKCNNDGDVLVLPNGPDLHLKLVRLQ